MWGFYNNSKKVKCIDCGHCFAEEMMCYPDSMDAHKEYKLTEEDLVTLANCDFYIDKK